MVSYRRIRESSVATWMAAMGVAGAPIIFLFAYLASIGAITVTGHSGDIYCAGTLQDPCYAYINFTANTDIFIYPDEDWYFSTDRPVKGIRLLRSWGAGWREINLTKGCTGSWCGCYWCTKSNTAKFSYVFRNNTAYQIVIVGYKHNPYDTIKWSFGSVDPYWYPNESAPVRTLVEDWEEGSINSSFWETFSSDATYGRIQVTGTGTPHGGSYHILMDVSSSGHNNRNAFITKEGLFTGAHEANITFWHKEFGEEDDDCPDSWTGYDPGQNNGDCVAFTCDNNTWYKAVDLAPGQGSYALYSYSFTDHPNWCGTANSSFRIWFGQDDNYPYSTDGMAYDDINITATKLTDADVNVSLYMDSGRTDRTYEHGFGVNLTGTANVSEVEVCLNMSGFNSDFNCSNGSVHYDWSAGSHEWKFNDSAMSKNITANSSFYVQFLNETLEVQSAEINVTGFDDSGDYPESVEMDVGNDGHIDIEIFGILNGTTVETEKFNNSAASVNITFSDSGGQKTYVKLPCDENFTSATMSVRGFEYGAGNETDFPDKNIDTIVEVTSPSHGYISDRVIGMTGNDTVLWMGLYITTKIRKYTKDGVNLGNTFSGYGVGLCHNGTYLFGAKAIDNEIYVYNPDTGTEITHWTAAENTIITDIACNGSEIFVAEYGNGKIVIYNLTYDNISTLWLNDSLAAVDDVTSIWWEDSTGYLYASDFDDDKVYRFNHAGTYQGFNFDSDHRTRKIHGDGEYFYVVNRTGTTDPSEFKKYWNDNYPTNIQIDVGNDGTNDWNHTGSFSSVDITDDFASALDDYSFSSDCEGIMDDFPVMVRSNTTGIMELLLNKTARIRYNPNPIDMNVTAIQDFVNGSSNLNVNITSTTSGRWGTIQFDAMNITYYGDQDYNVTAAWDGNDTYNSGSETWELKVRWSNISVTIPDDVWEVVFAPANVTKYNATPYGQSDSVPFLNVTAYRDWDTLIYASINESSDDCWNFSMWNTSSIESMTIVENSSRNLYLNLSYNEKGALWSKMDIVNCTTAVTWMDRDLYIDPICSDCYNPW